MHVFIDVLLYSWPYNRDYRVVEETGAMPI